MERNDYRDELVSFLQENADSHKLYPSDKVWNNIHQHLHPGIKWSNYVIAAVIVASGIAGAFFDARIVISKKQQPATQQTLIAENYIPRKGVKNKDAELPKNESTGSASLTFHPIKETKSLKTVQATNKGSDSRNVHYDPIRLPTGSSVIEHPNHSVIFPLQENESIAAAVSDLDAGSFTPIADISLTITPTQEHQNKIRTIAASGTWKEKVSMSAIRPRLKRSLDWSIYFSPTISFRNLSGEGIPSTYLQAGNTQPILTNTDVNSSVTHKPSMGFQLGSTISYPLTRSLKLRTGIQLALNRYEVQAFNFMPELAPMSRGVGRDEINVVSTYRNYNGFSMTWLRNRHIMLDLPIGLELKLFGNDKITFNVAASLNPTVVLNNQAYMLSANMRNYAKEPSLYKRYNLAAGAEAFISIKGRSLRYQFGPQMRYQLTSSYKSPYPINEYLTDYGIRFGISR